MNNSINNFNPVSSFQRIFEHKFTCDNSGEVTVEQSDEMKAEISRFCTWLDSSIRQFSEDPEFVPFQSDTVLELANRAKLYLKDQFGHCSLADVDIDHTKSLFEDYVLGLIDFEFEENQDATTLTTEQEMFVSEYHKLAAHIISEFALRSFLEFPVENRSAHINALNEILSNDEAVFIDDLINRFFAKVSPSLSI